MIRYALVCKAGHEFEGWFPGIEACDMQLEQGLVSCPDCGASKIKKALMAPSVAPKKSDSGQKARAVAALAEQRAKLAAVRAHVEQNFENVGERFTEEARRIHYGETERRDIYGEASLADAKELVEEGVEIAPLPGPAREDA